MKDSRIPGFQGSSDMLKNYKELRLAKIVYTIAYGSVCELETQVMISGDLGYVEKERLGELRGEIGDVERMLKALIKSLESKHLDP